MDLIDLTTQARSFEMSTDARRYPLRELYLHAISLEGDAERQSFLQEACENHPQLGSRLEKLLASRGDDRAERLLEKAGANMQLDKNFSLSDQSQDGGDDNAERTLHWRAGFESGATLRSRGRVPSVDLADHPMIGHYKLLEEIGHGGMGTVYMAEQTEPVKRQVALKVIKPGMDTREVIGRFEAERQALAMMDHPNIAKVFDGGTTDSGRPYFVMELVRGQAITEFCEQKKLSLRDRLELFVEVCKAVQHAHQKGIIHRDLKPSNVMVTLHDGRSVVKVIDFGVAKALNQELTECTLFTHFSQMIGTPLYMAPEQTELSGLGVDTRSDIYSLGVVLYELLTGTTPFDRETMSKMATDSLRKLIQEQEPPRPSARVSTLKAAGRTTLVDPQQIDAQGIAKQLKSELDWIVMKALEKDRERRYETANAFAADVQRYLDDEPVEACPPSMLYRSRKLVRRYQTAVFMFATVLLALTVTTFASSFWAIKANRSAEQLDRQKQIALHAAATAEKNERNAMRLAYSADMRLAAQSLADGDIRRLSDLLGQHSPTNASRDLRGLEWWYLRQYIDADSQQIAGGPDAKTVVRFSSNGRHLVVGQDDGELKFLDGPSLALKNSVDSYHGFVRGIDFSPDSRRLASIGDDGMIRLWDIAKQKPVLSFRAHENHGFRVFYISEGKQLISCGEESDARLWDVATGQQIGSLQNHSYGVEMAAMDVSSDRKRCTFQNRYGTVNVIDLKTEKVICQLSHGQHSKRVCYATCAKFSPDDRYIAVGTNLNDVYVCDAETGHIIKEFSGHRDVIQSLAFHPSGELLASGDKAGVIRTWSLSELFIRSEQGQGPADLWNANFHGHSARIWSMAFTSDGERLITASRDHALRSWPKREPLRLEIDDASDAAAVAFTGSGSQLLIAGKSALNRWHVDNQTLSGLATDLSNGARSIAIESDANRCLTGHVGGVVQIWDLSTGQLTAQIQAHPETVTDMAISENGQLLATGSWDGNAKLWDLSDFSGIATFDLERPHCYGLAISPDNRLLACATESVVVLFEIATRQVAGTLVGHQDSVRSVVFSPDGSTLATASDDRTIRLWDTESGDRLHVLPAHLDRINAIAFSPDGRTLIGVDESGAVSFSNVKTGQFLFRKKVSESEILDLALSPDSKHLALAIRNAPTMLIRLSTSKATQAN